MATEHCEKNSRGNKACHAKLINLCNISFAREQLGQHPPYKVEMVRAIALANIRRNRVSGLLAHAKPDNLHDWMANYLRNILACLDTQREQWARFRHDPRHPELLAVLEKYINFWARDPEDKAEILSAAYDETYIKIANQYPFDVTLEEWLREIVRRVHINLLRSRRVAQVTRHADGEVEEVDLLEILPAEDYESQPGLWSNGMDWNARIDQLKPRRQMWLRMRMDGRSNAEIAHEYGVSEKTVLNTMRLIGLELGFAQKRQ